MARVLSYSFSRTRAFSKEVEIIWRYGASTRPDPTPMSALETALREWYSFTASETPLSQPQRLDLDGLIRDLPKTYSIYGLLLPLPQHAFQSAMWTTLRTGCCSIRGLRESYWQERSYMIGFNIRLSEFEVYHRLSSIQH